MKFLLGLCLSCLALFIGSCGEGEAAQPDKLQVDTLSSSVSHFNWSYFDVLPKDRNCFYSPYSLSSALGLTAKGATGETRQELFQALGVRSLTRLEEDQLAFRKYLKKNYGRELVLTEANLVAIDKTKAGKRGLNKEFKNTAQKIYGAETRLADFAHKPDKERENIRKWVDKSTKRFIPDYKSIATSATTLDIINAVYFDGRWEKPFEEEWTKEDFFTSQNGGKAKVPMMRRSFEGEAPYYADDKYQGVRLTYRGNRPKDEPSASLYLILPKTERNLGIAADWSKESLTYRQEFLAKLRATSPYKGEVDVMLPRLNLDERAAVKENLQAMGVRQAFTPTAEINRLVNNLRLAIDDVQHQAKLKIDESGTVAAAVTEIAMVKSAAPQGAPTPYIPFFCNRPFIFVIADDRAGVDLFTGVINSLGE